MSRTLQFVSNASAPSPEIPQSSGLFGARFQDLRLAPGMSKLVVRFPDGETEDAQGLKVSKTPIRIIPAIEGSEASWILPYSTVEWDNFRCRSTPGDAFAVADQWFKQNAKEELYDQEKNKSGFKLFSKGQGIAWVVFWHEGAPRIGILQSGFSKKGSGILASIVAESAKSELDPTTNTETPIYPGGLADPKTGRIITVYKTVDTKIKNKQFGTSYSISAGTQAAPLAPFLEKVSDEDYAYLKPLEEVLGNPTEEEKKAALKQYLGGWYPKIFG